VPLLADEYLFRAILIPFLIMALAAMGLNILVGYCGQISLGTGAFMAVGAYAAYNFFVRIDGMPVIVAILLGGVWPRSRACCSASRRCASRGCTWRWPRWPRSSSSTGPSCASSGSPTIRPPAPSAWPTCQLFGVRIDTRLGKYLFCLGFVVVFALVAKNLVRGHIGREWMAMRDMDVAAAVIGIRPVYAKLTAFAVSSFFVGVAGALWGFVHLGSWEPAAFNIDRSFQLLFMVIIGGLGSIMGSFFGAAFIVVLPIFLNQRCRRWARIGIDTARR
jgi:branched-chain amino acid transport system permease protein